MDDEVEIKMAKAREWSSFVMDDVLQSKEEIEKIKKKLKVLQADLEEEFDVNEEKIFVNNFISFLHWRLGDREKAFAASKRALELEEEPNLVNRCNEVLFHIELEKHYCSKKLLDEIYEKIKNKRLQFRATAEIGYCYSRLGPQRHEKAVQLFQRAIQGIAPERNLLWEFRLALTLRRQSHFFQMTTAENYRPEEKKEEAARLFYEILKFPTDEYCRIKARSWCQMSRTLFKGKNLFEIIHTDKEKTMKIDEKRCFEEAMKLCPDDYFVLQEYGIHLRYIEKMEESTEMLKKAIQLRDTNFARHHLALTLQKTMESVMFMSSMPEAAVSLDVEQTEIESKSDATDLKLIFISNRKSPRSVCVSRDNPLLLQAVEHLQKAIEMSQGFDVARYDLGLIYRMLDKPDDALRSFSFITSNNCGKPSEYPMSLINAYEQQAICKLDLISKETDPKRKEELQYDAKKSLWKALSITSGFIWAIPLLKTTNQCFLILKELLQNEEKSFSTSKELATLHELLGYDEESIKFHREIADMECNSTTVKELAQSYIKVGDFENAICTLALLKGEKEWDTSFKLNFVNACLEGAKNSLMKNDLEMAKIRFLNAYTAIFFQHIVSASKEEQNVSTSKEEQNALASKEEQKVLTSRDKRYIPASKEELIISTSKKDQNLLASKEEKNVSTFREEQYVQAFKEEQNNSTLNKEQHISACNKEQNAPAFNEEQNVSTLKEKHDDNTLDILVLHSCGEDSCRYLNFVQSTLLSFVQLKYAINDNDCLPFRRKIDYLIEEMRKSRCILIIQHENRTKDEFIDQALKIALVKHRTKTLKIRKEGVDQDELVCKEVILSCDLDENENTERSQRLQGDLFSDVLKKVSQM
ncbi:uncharacterized protein LOC128189358 [Crassostrea angulata]|uniref:uncharacterized protein LOC128189358 n=1 Tax=Magallana angulata TaxID=2784310 RepID=UPI0022B1DACC|nr:uncharacterized protein LOC128189358 [Crassostrea angulata]